jgi:hypothetical protein
MSLASNPGAWVPWDVVERVVALRLRPPSRWQVFLVILFTSSRYGRRDARLSVAEIAARTGLSERTVKSAIGELCKAGLVRRTGRYRRLAVPLLNPPVTEVELRLPPIGEGE